MYNIAQDIFLSSRHQLSRITASKTQFLLYPWEVSLKYCSCALCDFAQGWFPKRFRAGNRCKRWTMTRWIFHDTEPLSWSVLCCTLVYMRRMNLKMLRPIGRRAQSLNPQCSQSHFHPLRRNNPLPPAPTNKTQALKSCNVTWVELFHQRRHCAGDGVSSDEQVISQISPWTLEKKTLFV